MMRRRRGRETEDEKGEGILYCLYAGVAPTMITNQCYFSQVQAGEAKTSHGGIKELLPYLEKRGRAEVSGRVV